MLTIAAAVTVFTVAARLLLRGHVERTTSLSLFVLVAAAMAVGLLPTAASGQRHREPKHLVGGSIGYAMTSATSGSTDGTGGWLAGEYAYALSDWFQPRAYAGLALTFSERDEEDCITEGEPVNRSDRREPAQCDVSAKIFFLGAKGRLTVPIPFIAPFLELGVGVSLGVLRTMTFEVNEETEGIAYHLPVTLGVALGERHEFELAASFLFHPEERQATGALAFGLMFRVGH